MESNLPVSDPALICTFQIPYGIGIDALRAVIDTWPGPGASPVIIATDPVADASEPPPDGASLAQPGGPWATVRCERPADLFLLGRRFERTLRKQVFEENPSVSACS